MSRDFTARPGSQFLFLYFPFARVPFTLDVVQEEDIGITAFLAAKTETKIKIKKRKEKETSRPPDSQLANGEATAMKYKGSVYGTFFNLTSSRLEERCGRYGGKGGRPAEVV